MLKFKTSCAVLAYLSFNLLNEVGLSLFRYFEVGLRVCDIVVKKFTFAISSFDEFLWKMVKNCVRNRPRPDEIDTETEICTFLKSEFYFRFCRPPSTKSALISYISVWVFVTIRWKIWPPQSRNCQNRSLHNSKIGNLLPVCLRNKSLRNNQISERHAKFGENR